MIHLKSRKWHILNGRDTCHMVSKLKHIPSPCFKLFFCMAHHPFCFHHAQIIRDVDFRQRDRDLGPGVVERVELDPNRSAFLALVRYEGKSGE